MTRANSFQKFTTRLSDALPGKTIASLLVIELLLAQLAIASPQLHDWMHGVDDCHHHAEHSPEGNSESQEQGDHVCTIGLLSVGLIQETDTCEVRTFTLSEDRVSDLTFIPNGPAIVRHSARSPPQV